MYRTGFLVTTMLLVGIGLTVSGAGVGPAAGVAATGDETVTEQPYIEPAPEPGDDYFEVEAADGRWISYMNPRDEYRSPYLGDGSGKICVTLLNEAGEPIVGETVPNTTVTVPTGESLSWHTGADPITVEYPLTDYYERPLDADQFGTTDDLPQGDGYMDSHCIEFHGPDETDSIEYGEATVSGSHADDIELVGYIQQDGQAWESDVDPLSEAVDYEAAGGGWTYTESHSHGQAVVVLQLAPDDSPGESGDSATDESADTTAGESVDATGSDDAASDTDHSVDDADSTDDTTILDSVGISGSLAVGLLVAVVGVMLAVLAVRRYE